VNAKGHVSIRIGQLERELAIKKGAVDANITNQSGIMNLRHKDKVRILKALKYSRKPALSELEQHMPRKWESSNFHDASTSSTRIAVEVADVAVLRSSWQS
jgi:hypothetical protein